MAGRGARTFKHDDTFIVLDSHGDALPPAGIRTGCSMRHPLSVRLQLVLDEVQPLLLGSNLRDDNAA